MSLSFLSFGVLLSVLPSPHPLLNSGPPLSVTQGAKLQQELELSQLSGELQALWGHKISHQTFENLPSP